MWFHNRFSRFFKMYLVELYRNFVTCTLILLAFPTIPQGYHWNKICQETSCQIVELGADTGQVPHWKWYVLYKLDCMIFEHGFISCLFNKSSFKLNFKFARSSFLKHREIKLTFSFGGHYAIMFPFQFIGQTLYYLSTCMLSKN